MKAFITVMTFRRKVDVFTKTHKVSLFITLLTILVSNAQNHILVDKFDVVLEVLVLNNKIRLVQLVLEVKIKPRALMPLIWFVEVVVVLKIKNVLFMDLISSNISANIVVLLQAGFAGGQLTFVIHVTQNK